MGATITYNGSVIAEVLGGRTKKVKTAGTYLEGDLTVEAEEVIDSPLPIEFSTEEEAAAIIESGEIGGVYKYTGTTTESYENGELYVLEGSEEADALQGTWVFNETIDRPSTSSAFRFTVTVNFSTNGQEHDSVRLAYDSRTNPFFVGYRISGSLAYTEAYEDGIWSDEAYKTIIITSTYEEISTTGGTSTNPFSPDSFLSWLQANATKQSSTQLVKLINQTDLEELTVTENGDYTASVGYSKVTVNVPSSGGGGIDGGYTVTFMSNGATYASLSILQGGSISAPSNPTIEGHTFIGWYTGEGGTGDQISFPYTPSSDITLYADFAEQIIVGITGLTNADGTLTLTDGLAGLGSYTESVNGDYVSVTSPLSEYFPFSEIEEFTDDEGNVFVKYPQFWMKWEVDDSGVITGYKFANEQVDEEYFIPDAFLDPSNTTEDTYLPYFALGKYEMSGSTSKGYSKSGETCLVNVTRANARSAARAYGSAANLYNGYQQLDFAQFVLYNLLCMMFYQQSNIQKVYGGRTGAGTVTSWSEASVTGTCDGLSGMDGWNTSTDCVKMLGIENPYGNIFKWVDGAYFSGATIYAHRYPQQFADSASNGIELGFSRPTSSDFIKSLQKGTAAETQSYVYCSETGGSASEYYGDKCYYNSSGVVLVVGGYWDSPSNAGLWSLYGNHIASNSYSFIGARLSYRPL